MEINSDFQTPDNKKRGRPRNDSGGTKKAGRPSKMSKKKAKQFAKAVSNNPKNSGLERSSDRLYLQKKSENPELWKSIPCPTRRGHELSQDQIDCAIRTIYVMKEDNESDVFEKVSRYLDIGTKTLYKLWRDFVRHGKVPNSFRGTKRAVRMKLVSMEWFEPIREEIERLRLKEKRAVELPDIQKWLLEMHDIAISRSRLRYRLFKMGFIFSKTHKLTMKKEEARIRKLRQDYLKHRHEYDKIIKDNNERYYLLKEKNLEIPEGMMEIIYIYLDESYVNRYCISHFIF